MVNIKLAGKDISREQKAKEQLERLLGKYEISKYLFTNSIIIEYYAVPHSHPVLTLSTRFLDNDNVCLLTLIHEQLHWYTNKNQGNVDKVIKELKKLYHDVPVGFPEGARNEESTYLHLLVCALEYKAAKDLLGEDEAKFLMEFWKTDVYRWIYRTVEKDYEKLVELFNKYSLKVL